MLKCFLKVKVYDIHRVVSKLEYGGHRGQEEDLGVIVSANMKVSEQCNIAAKKGNMMLGFIRRHICNRDKSLINHCL